MDSDTSPRHLADELVGVWSNDCMYGPGAPADEILIFAPDGSGRFEVYNWLLCSVDYFAWSVSAPGVVEIRGLKSLQVEPDEKLTYFPQPSDFTFTGLNYAIAVEDTPSGKSLRVLRLKLYDWVADHYGLVQSDLAGYEEPDFPS
ncbi:MAG: hypothetical protein ACT4NL_01615 [Pseudomarimonas sp.]